MSLLNSLTIGAGGMTAHGEAISAVGDNISNVSTIGFKRGRAGFADILGGTLGGHRLGAGVRLGGVDTQFDQGSIQQTGAPLDLAIRGHGMFVVKGNHDGLNSTFFTRDGRFGVDAGGFVVDPRGLRLQGYVIDPTGAVATSATDLAVAGVTSQPVATTSAKLTVNLDSGSAVSPAWNPATPDTTSAYQTTVTVHDSLGTAHEVQVYFHKSAAGAWDWHAMVDGGELTGGAAGTPTEIASGTLGFTTTGALDTEATLASSASFVGATPNQAIAFDFGDAITTDGGTGFAGSTQFDAPSTVNALDIDGRGAGNLIDLSVGEDGTVRGVYDNGDNRDLARVALALFPSEMELSRAGDGLFVETSASGQPLIDAAGTGGRGALSSGALEGSNVDLGAELVTMIAYQRAFQANVKTVTTADEMLAEVNQLKR